MLGVKQSDVKHEVRNQAVYYAMKGAGAALIAGGVAIAVTGSIYTWPKVAGIIGSTINGMPVETVNCLHEALVNLISLFINAVQWCANMGDIGGFCMLGIVTFGTAVVLVPIVIAFGLPILAGSLVSSGGLALWNEADNWCSNQ